MNDLPSTKRMTIWIENVEEFEKSWEKLISANVGMIYPAHGNPFLPKELVKYKGYIPKVRLRKLV